MSTPVDTIILKVAAPCNLDCTYCYEYQGDDSWKSMPPVIPEDVLVSLAERIREHAAAYSLHHVNVNAHGGEPMLLGAQRLAALFSSIRANAGSAEIRFGMQTNATLATPEIAQVLVDHQVSVGISLDGDRAGNSRRVGHDQRPAYDRIIKGIQVLQDGGANIAGGLCVINRSASPRCTLQSLAQLGFERIDLLQPYGTHDTPPEQESTGAPLGAWWREAFDEWVSSPQLQTLKIRFFEDAIKAVIQGESTSDWFGNASRDYIVVRSDGSYEGMDTIKVAGYDGRVLNMNVHEHSIDEASRHPELTRLTVEGGTGPLAPECSKCPIVDWCGGGYLPTRFGRCRGYRNPSIYCLDLQELFARVATWVVDESRIPDAYLAPIEARLKRLMAEGISDRLSD